MEVYEILSAKRDGKALSSDEIQYFIKGVTSGSIPDYQITAFLMAVCIQGMNSAETAALAFSMAKSGETADLSDIDGIKVDKHSTGGVGDKTSLVALPLAAACNVPVAKMSGRGLGHTGGTIDKLSAIPKFKTDLTQKEFIDTVKRINISIIESTNDLAPADKRLYALRDVTATVESIPLIASSIMSKKLAGGADSILLDVKAGYGAFMKTADSALALSDVMIDIGAKTGHTTAALVTDMDTPLGCTVGNALELIEVFDTLKGHGPSDLTDLSIELAADMLYLSGNGEKSVCVKRVKDALYSGKGLQKLQELIEAQHGNPLVAENYSLLPRARFSRKFTAPRKGYITEMRADKFGEASLLLGAGRKTKEDTIDKAAGIVLHKKPGDTVDLGQPVFTLYANHEQKLDNGFNHLLNAVVLSDTPGAKKPLIIKPAFP